MAELPTLRLQHLAFTYGRSRRRALDGVTADFYSRSIAVLGPNGAGKSTLFSVLATARRPAEGEVELLGKTVDYRSRRWREHRSGLGLVPQSLRINPSYTCSDFLRYAAWLKKVPAGTVETAVNQALERVDLLDRATSKVGSLSGGMHQRLCLASGLVNRPRLLLLDEPTVGLDPLQRADLLRHLGQITQQTVVVMATHLVEDVATLADEVMVLDAGRAVFVGALDALCEKERSLISGHDVEAAYRRLLTQQAA